MAIIFRGTKGTPLTHQELDNNFREFYYSASYSGNVITLYKSQSNAEPFRLPYPTASGYDTYIQLKSGNNESGSNEFLTSSPNFRFNYSSSILHVTGTYQHKGNVNINGVLTAQKYVTTLVSSSIVYTSGSTKFGDTADDLHSFTGKVYVEGSEHIVGPFTQSGDQKITGNQLFTGNKTQSGTLNLIGSHIQTGNTERTGTLLQVGDTTITGSLNQLGNNNLTGDLNVSKNVEIGNNLEVGNNVSITGSLHTTGNQITLGTITGNSSTLFGDSLFQTHTFTGSVNITGSATADYFIGDGSQILNVISSSYSVTSSYSNNSTSASYSVTSSHALTASYAENAASFPYTGSAEITGSLNVIGTVTGTSFLASGGVGIPTLVSANNIILSASNYVQIKDAFLKLNSFTNAQTASYSATNGDIYYNSSDNRFYGYTNGSWQPFETGVGGIITSYTNASDNRLITSVDGSSINAESKLTWDGTTLQINSSSIKDYSSSDTDVTGLVGGSNFGTLIESKDNGHIVLGIRDNDTSDSFAIVSGEGDFYAGNAYTKLAFQVSGSGQTYIGGELNVDGAINATGDVTAFASSDKRLKDNITPISDAINKLNQIGGYEFDWNSNSSHSGHDVGVIAQEIEKVLPEVVAERKDGYKAVRYEKIVALLIEAIKDQQLQIEELKSKL